MVTKFPIESKAGSDRSHIGDQGELWFAAALPRGWVWQPPRRDFGKDGLIVVRDQTNLHNLEFSVQIKTTEKPTIKKEHLVLSGIPRSSVQYWFASPLPTLVVVVDISNRRGWYAWHIDLFDAPHELFGSKAATVSLSVPAENQLDNVGWDNIRSDLRSYFSALNRAVQTDNLKNHLISTVNSISRITSNLIRLSAFSVPKHPVTEKEGISLLIEQYELHDLMQSVDYFLGKIVFDSDGHKQIAFWLNTFEELALAAHPSIRDLPPKDKPIPADFQFSFAPDVLLENRSKLVLAAIDLTRMLTSSQPI